MLSKALLILSGNAAASLLLLARNLIVARFLAVSDYGVAATFALAMGVVEMASTLGLQQQIIQAKEGDDPRFQAALQGFQLLRGCLSGLVLFVISGPFAQFMGIPEVAWAYQILAVVPILNALQHFDIHRLNRQMRFVPLLVTGTVPALVALAVVWPLAVFFSDWRVMLWSIIAQAAIGVVTSHLMAERSYQLIWDKAIMARSLNFGWPLLMNAILLFLVFQGDKLIVGRMLGVEALAIFAMGMTLTLTPTLVIARSASNLFLPRLSRAVETPDFTKKAQQTLQAISFSALLFVLLTLLLGSAVVQALLGEKYEALLPLLIWLALGQALRVMKAGPALVALALGQTSNAMAANIVRIMGFPLSLAVLKMGGDLLDVLVVCFVAEGLGLGVSLAMMLLRGSLPRAKIIFQQGLMAAMMGIIAVWVWFYPLDAAVASWQIWLCSGVALLTACLVLPEITRKRAP